MSRVLMIDNATLFQMLETSFLRRWGWEIVRARRGDELLEKARALPPDLILLESGPPELDAPECVAELKRDTRLQEVPIIVVAAPDEADRCSGAGADAVLTHPVQPSALEMTLCSLGRVSHRECARRSARVRVRVEALTGPLRGKAKDISRTGLFLSLREKLPLNAPVDLALKLPVAEGRGTVRAHGVVVRQVDADPESHLIPGVGVRFVELDAMTESIIDRYVNQAMIDGRTSNESFAHGEGS